MKAEHIGWEFKFLLDKNFNDPKLVNRPVFFKYTIDDGEPIIPPESRFERVFIPWNKVYDSNAKVLKFLNNLIPSFGAPRSHFYNFYTSISNKVHKDCVSMSYIVLRHESTSKTVMNKSIKVGYKEKKNFKTFCLVPTSESYKVGAISKVFKKKYKLNEKIVVKFSIFKKM